MTSPRPDEFDIPSHFQHWPGDNAEDSIGPFFYFMEDGDSCTAFRAQPRNCNSHGSAHGGVLMAFADYTLCIAANGGAHRSVVTVSQNNEFIAPVHAGDLISGRGEVVRSGGSIVFVRGELCVGDETVLICSAVIKRLRQS